MEQLLIDLGTGPQVKLGSCVLSIHRDERTVKNQIPG